VANRDGVSFRGHFESATQDLTGQEGEGRANGLNQFARNFDHFRSHYVACRNHDSDASLYSNSNSSGHCSNFGNLVAQSFAWTSFDYDSITQFEGIKTMKQTLLIVLSSLILSGCESTTSITNNLTSPTSPSIIPATQTTNSTCPTCPTQPCSTTQNCTGTGTPNLRLPEIVSFNADSPRTSSKLGTFLRWDVSDFNASVRIDPGIGSVGSVGFIFVNPSVTTLYTLTARNSIGTVQRVLLVTVFTPEA